MRTTNKVSRLLCLARLPPFLLIISRFFLIV